MQPELSNNYVEVPLGDGTTDRNSPLYVRVAADNDQVNLSIRGDTSFRNQVGEQLYKDYLEFLDPTWPTSIRDRLLSRLGLF